MMPLLVKFLLKYFNINIFVFDIVFLKVICWVVKNGQKFNRDNQLGNTLGYVFVVKSKVPGKVLIL